MKIALITDQHFGIRNDSIEMHDHYEKFYNEFFFPTIDKEKIDTVIQLGDIFDRRKYINFYSLNRCKRYFFDKIQSRSISFHNIVGNHDIYYKNTNSINAPNLLLKEYNFNIYDEAVEWSCKDGVKILFVPWINQENYKKTHKLITETDAQIVMGHFEFKGFEMYKGSPSDHGYSTKPFEKFDMVMSGHFHHKSNKDNIYYLGSPYEMTWSDYNDPRGFHIFDTKTQTLEYYQNPFSIFQKVFYDDESKTAEQLLNIKSDLENVNIKIVVKNKSNPYTFDQFIDKINEQNPMSLQVVEDHLNLDLIEDDEIIDENEDTITIINNYVKNMDIKNTKDVKNLLIDLYNTALSME